LPDHVAAGDILVNPVHVGSGQKTKIMDAAALGTVVVTAPEGLASILFTLSPKWG
jgi:hypothetical protein